MEPFSLLDAVSLGIIFLFPVHESYQELHGNYSSCYCRQYLFSHWYHFEFVIGNGGFHYYKIHFLKTLSQKCIKLHLSLFFFKII